MKKNLIAGFSLIIFNLNYFCQNNNDSVIVYLAKENWHTGIIIQINDFTKENLTVLKYFEPHYYADIGWGDEDFYQAPDFDLYFAAKAILVPSSSVVRIGGYSFSIEQIIQFKDYVIEFTLSKNQFLNMFKFINNSLAHNENDEYISLNKLNNNNRYPSIIFFKSILKYHALKTCNTWAGEALKAAGINIRTFGLVTADQLFNRLKSIGQVIKSK